MNVVDVHINLYSVFRKHLAVKEYAEWLYWKSDGNFPLIPYHIRVEAVALFLCRNGYIDMEINLKEYRFAPGKILVLLPEHILRIKNVSGDYVGCGLIASENLWKEARRETEKINLYYASVRELPCIPVTQDQSELLLLYLNIFSKKHDTHNMTHNLIITRKLLTILLYEIHRIYIGLNDSLPQSGKKEKMLQEFLRLVAAYFRQERGLQFYADRFQVTPRYLSAVIKEASRQSATEWIDNYVIAEAGILLRTTNLSIKEIADSLNFADQSFFGKYFKRHTGMSPKEYKIL